MISKQSSAAAFYWFWHSICFPYTREQRPKELVVFEVIPLKSAHGDKGICSVGSALYVNDQVWKAQSSWCLIVSQHQRAQG